MQYRGQLMPLVRTSDEVRVRTEGAQPLLVFSDAGRSMGLVVDEIVDIVEDRLDIQVGSETMGVLGSAVIKGQATEIIDIGHFLPLAFEDWFRRKEMKQEALTRTLLFVDDSAFFRNMLVPVLKAAGYDVTAVGAADEALTLVKKGEKFDVIVSDIEMPRENGYAFIRRLRSLPPDAGGTVPAVAVTAHGGVVDRIRVLSAGFQMHVPKPVEPAELVAAVAALAEAAGGAPSGG